MCNTKSSRNVGEEDWLAAGIVERGWHFLRTFSSIEERRETLISTLNFVIDPSRRYLLGGLQQCWSEALKKRTRDKADKDKRDDKIACLPKSSLYRKGSRLWEKLGLFCLSLKRTTNPLEMFLCSTWYIYFCKDYLRYLRYCCYLQTTYSLYTCIA